MAAQRSIGTTLAKMTGGTATLIANIKSLGEIGVENSEIDVTTLDSANNYKEFIAGFKDAGELSLSGLVKSETNMAAMLALAEGQTVESWEMVFPSGSKWEFSAFVKSWKEDKTEVEGVRGFTGSLRISGKPTYTPAA